MPIRLLIALLLVANYVVNSQPRPASTFDVAQVRTASPFAGGPRDDGSGFSVDGVGYFGCGSDASFNARNDWYAYNHMENTWHSIADLPAKGRQYATALSNGQMGYVFGGILQDGTFSNQCFEYNPRESAWQELKTPLPERGKAVGFNIGPMLYLGTGIGDSVVYNDWWQLNTMNNQWKQLDTLPFSPRYEMIGFSANGFGYLLLGQNEVELFQEVWQFNPIDLSWRRLSDFPGQARTFSCAIAEPYGAIVAGGMGVNESLLDEVYHYETHRDQWSVLSETMPSIIRGMEGFSIGNSIFFVGGLTPQFTRSASVLEFVVHSDRYQPEVNVWPNPVRGNATLMVELSDETIGTLELYNTIGAQLLKMDIRGGMVNPVSFTGIKNGVYFLKLALKNSKQVIPIVVAN